VQEVCQVVFAVLTIKKSTTIVATIKKPRSFMWSWHLRKNFVSQNAPKVENQEKLYFPADSEERFVSTSRRKNFISPFYELTIKNICSIM